MPHTHRPRTMAFSFHLMLFIKARWLLVLGSALGVLAIQFALRLALPYFWLYATIGVIAFYNSVFWWYLRRTDFHEDPYGLSEEGKEGWHLARNIALGQIVFDLFALFALLHFTGGLENPFVIFFMLHMVMATILLEPIRVVLVGIIVTVLVFALGITERVGIIDHYHIPQIYGTFEPLDSWLFVLGIPGIILVMNVCFIALMFFMMREINNRRDHILELSEELEEKNSRLLRLDSRRKQTMAVASHDLKSPIDAVSSYLIMMKQGYLGEMTGKQLDVVGKSLARLTRLREFVSDVLDWQTIERGELQQVMEPTQLMDILRDVVDDYRDPAARKEISMVLEMPENAPLVSASSRRMAQVFDNLVSNAVKYTDDGGEVRVQVTLEDMNIIIGIADSGIGMSPEEMEHLFEDFYRSPRVKRSHEGTGLGLSVVQRIMAAHHGRVWAESELGNGTHFYVSVPIGRLSQPPRGSITPGKPQSS